jgi:hypothetical protein
VALAAVPPDADAPVAHVHAHAPAGQLVGEGPVAPQDVEQPPAEEGRVLGLGAHPHHHVLGAEDVLDGPQQRRLAHAAVAGDQRPHAADRAEHLGQLLAVPYVVGGVDGPAQVGLDGPGRGGRLTRATRWFTRWFTRCFSR